MKFNIDDALDVIKAPKEIKEKAKKSGLPFYFLYNYFRSQENKKLTR